jgi:hypothetical protein
MCSLWIFSSYTILSLVYKAGSSTIYKAVSSNIYKAVSSTIYKAVSSTIYKGVSSTIYKAVSSTINKAVSSTIYTYKAASSTIYKAVSSTIYSVKMLSKITLLYIFHCDVCLMVVYLYSRILVLVSCLTLRLALYRLKLHWIITFILFISCTVIDLQISRVLTNAEFYHYVLRM